MFARSTIINLFSSQRQVTYRFNKLLGSLLLMLALGNGGFHAKAFYSLEAGVSGDRPPELQVEHRSLAADASIVGQRRQFSNGIYLYGSSPQPEQLGQTYTVFEVRRSRVIGAFYMPRSSFDCFYGSLESDRLAITIINSYDRTPYSYSIALAPQSETTSGNDLAIDTAEKIGLAGFYPIDRVSWNDRRILGACKQNYQQHVWN